MSNLRTWLTPEKNPAASSLFLKAAALAMATACAAPALADVLNPIIGPVLFEESFNGATLDSTRWNLIDGDGCGQSLCGWGNAELENYDAKNVAIEDVPFEPGTRALAITAKREAKGKSVFTSGKITSYDKVQVKYGLIEFRMSTPQVGIGLWPAGWMLGTSLATWPKKGELDIMEMGNRAAGMFYQGSDVNSYVGSNAISYATSACVTGNESCAASTAWKTANAYVASTPLINRFVTYRLYWTDTQLRFTVVDNGIEHDMYNAPIPIAGENAVAFQAPFYLLFNLAVGGNFTDAKTADQVTAPLPGKLYIDYVRVYQLDGLGEVKLGSQVRRETGNFGVFTDTTPTTNKEIIGVNTDFWVWENTFVPGSATPAEGANVLALKSASASHWFGAGFSSRELHDMSLFASGNVKFKIKIPADVAFKIGVSDNYTNSNSVTFPANETKYGLVRNGEWGQATIPVSELRGTKIALQAMKALFTFANGTPLPAATFDVAIDDIVWECGSSAECNPVASSSSVASASVASSSSSVASTSSASSASVKSSSVSSSSASSAAAVGTYKIVSTTSVIFTVASTTAPWVDLHYSVNNGGARNVRMTHNADNTNTYTVTNIPLGALVGYNFTSQKTGMVDPTRLEFTMPTTLP